ncbi:hypothetical protein C8J57DRAFT_1464226 [Mycena rebaudengoi]|nr:hypothetical protein C8J57DRAFT_1464226 [Mycena rebaudengoi]
MISELCAELLHTIGSELSTPDQKSLRAVSRHLRYVIEPLFRVFTAVCLVLDVGKPADGGPSQLEVLASGPTAWAHCRRLKILSLAPGAEGATGIQYKLANHRIQKFLRPALESLTGIRSVDWTIHDTDAFSAQLIVVEVLNARRTVNELRLVDKTKINDQFATLPPILNVYTLSVDAPANSWNSDSRFLPWIRQLVRVNPGLESLRFLSTVGCAQMCEILQRENIRLKSVSIPSADDALLRYLASYSGLERLEFGGLSYWQASLFFGSILPRHATSLVVLRCPANSEGECSFGRHHVALISELRRLETLEMSVNSSEMAPETEDKDIIELFLEMAVAMPALGNIAILPAAAGNCGIGIERNKRDMRGRIRKTMNAFAKEKGSPVLNHLVKTHHRRVKQLKTLSKES